jgi:undecaprenyl-diphosphatase
MEQKTRFFFTMLICAVLTFVLTFSGMAAEVDEPVLILEAPIEDSTALILSAPEDSTALVVGDVEDGEEPFQSKKIGQWLDKTFYKLDYAVFKAFSKIQSETMTKIVELVTHLGDSEIAIPLLIAGLIMAFFKKTRKVGLTLFFAIILGTLFTNVILKNVCGRARPYVTLANDPDFMSWYHMANAHKESDNSFPSGHTTCAFEMGMALFLSMKNKKIKWIFPVLAFAVLLTRIYLMVHYVTDVAAGFIVGTTAAVLAYFIVKKILSVEKIANFDLAEKIKKKA